MAFSALTIGAWATKKHKHLPRLSCIRGCEREKAYSWKAPDMTNAEPPQTKVGSPGGSEPEHSARRDRG